MVVMIERVRAEACGDGVPLAVLSAAVPAGAVEDAVAACGARERRVRKLPAALTVVLCLAMNWYAADSLWYVFVRLARAARWATPVSAAGLCRARYRVGARPVVALFRRVCRPLATPRTPGAFLFGLRLMAVDTAVVDVADTAANDRAFGRPGSARGGSAWPQAQLAALEECGTHAICDAGVWPCAADPHAAARRLLRSVGPGVLLLYDRGLHSLGLVTAALGRGAQVLGRLPASVHPRTVAALDDGTLIVRLRPSAGPRRHEREVTLRLVRYTLDDPARPGHRLEHRLVTSLLDPAQAPAVELAAAYHARWEIELAVDEIKTHQRLSAPLRSQHPVGVVQELYGLLVAHYAVRAVMADAAAAAGVPPTRLSFTHTLRVLRDALPVLLRTPASHRRAFHRALLADVAALHLPPRRDRTNPRVVKQKMSNFRVKRPEHRRPQPPTRPFPDAVVLLK